MKIILNLQVEPAVPFPCLVHIVIVHIVIIILWQTMRELIIVIDDVNNASFIKNTTYESYLEAVNKQF